MRLFLSHFRCGRRGALLLALVWFWVNAAAADSVTLKENARYFTLANGLVTARIEKASGDLVSLRYQGLELMASGRGSMGGYWSSVGRTRPSGEHAAVVRVNPATNGGTLAEVSCRTANVAGAPDAPLDIDIRYALIQDEPGIFTYCEWTHRAGYPPFSVGEARYCLKLNPAIFDFLTVDENRRRLMPSGADWDQGAPTNLKEARLMTTGVHKGEVEHKYDYSAVFSETPAYGWSSTRHNVGLWIINPSLEYLGGGPTKAELTGHLDVNPGGTPTLLNMWLGSHYGGTAFSVARDESWSKFIGPFLIYCNAAQPGVSVDATQRVLWQKALVRARAEAARWPYGWLVDSNYPRAWDRGAVSGQLVLHDPYDAAATMSNVWVGVTAPDFAPSFSGFGGSWRGGTNRFFRTGATNALARGALGRNGFPALQDWQRDAKHYQFWVRADAAGRFVIPNVRPGNYWLRAIADGVIGEFSLTNVAVNAGITTALGRQTWQPARYGRTVWQIGVPDRTAREFRHGDDYWHWGLYFKYVDEFPHDVNFVVGKSNWRTDWNYVQPPRIMHRTDIPVESEEDEAADAEARRRDPRDGVQSSVWSIRFNLTNAPAGRATLRLAFCGTHQGCDVEVLVNGQAAGATGPLPSTSTMQRDGIRAFWIEKPIAFDAALLKAGENLIQLRSRANTWSQGVLYDCVRLELQP